MMGRREGALTTLGGICILLSFSVVVYYYWQSPQQLLRYCFSLFLLLSLLTATRHLWFRVAGALRRRRFAREQQENGAVHVRPKLDQGREEARKKAQSVHNEKAEVFEQSVTSPRREQKLKQLEEKMKSIRGFHGEGFAVGSSSERENGRDGSRLVLEHDEHIRRRRVEQSNEASSHVTRTDQSDSEEEDEGGRLITIALKLPNKSVRKQFKTSYKVKSLYRWLRSLNYSPKFYCLATTVPRQLLLDTHQTLDQCGLTSDTALAVEERDD